LSQLNPDATPVVEEVTNAEEGGSTMESLEIQGYPRAGI
jgi:hypothetical protein